MAAGFARSVIHFTALKALRGHKPQALKARVTALDALNTSCTRPVAEGWNRSTPLCPVGRQINGIPRRSASFSLNCVIA